METVGALASICACSAVAVLASAGTDSDETVAVVDSVVTVVSDFSADIVFCSRDSIGCRMDDSTLLSDD